MKKLFLMFFIISPYLLFGQQNERKYGDIIVVEIKFWKFVSATNGLRARESPELNARVYGVLPYGSLKYFDLRTKDKFTIDGITDYWYAFHWIGEGPAWVFGGYLTDYFETVPIVGRWANEKDRNNLWSFHINGVFYDALKYGSVAIDGREASFEGTYDLKGNDLTLNFNMQYNDYGWGEERVPINKTRKAKIRHININRMEIIFDNETITLIRDNNG
jgi:hypothetical protein